MKHALSLASASLVLAGLSAGALADQETLTLDGPNHANAQLVGSIGNTETGFGAGGDVIGDIAIMGSQAQGGFLESNTGLKIIDVADPSHPQLLAIVPPPAETTNFLHTQLLDRDQDGTPELAVVASQRSPVENRGARIFDISDPANPVETAFFAIPGGGVHTLQRDPEDHNILILNLTSSVLGFDGTFDNPGGNTGGHVVILDVSDETDPQIVNVLRLDGWTSPEDNPSQFCHESMLFKSPESGIKYLWCAYWNAGLVAFQVTDEMGHYLTGPTGAANGPRQVARGSYCTGNFGGPVMTGSLDRPTCNTHNIIVLQNFVAYIGDEITNPPGGIHIVDVRDFESGGELREIAEVFPQNFGTGQRSQPNLRNSEAPLAHRLSAHNFYPNYDESLLAWAPYSDGLHVFDVTAMSPADQNGGNFSWIAQFHNVQSFSAEGGVQGTQGTPNTWTARFGDDGGSLDQRGCIHIFDKVTGYYIVGLRAPGEQVNSCLN